jgi:uncharacterized protein
MINVGGVVVIRRSRNGQVAEIPLQIKLANTFFSRFRGLMFRAYIPSNYFFQIVPCNSIHMFFMQLQINTIFLNKQNEILKLKKYVSPWTMVWSVAKAHGVLEMHSGTINAHGFEPGDTLKLD